MTDILFRLAEKMQGKAKGAAASDPRKGGDGLNGLFQKSGRVLVGDGGQWHIPAWIRN